MKKLVVEVLGEILFGHRFGFVASLENKALDDAFDKAVFQFGQLTMQAGSGPWLG